MIESLTRTEEELMAHSRRVQTGVVVAAATLLSLTACNKIRSLFVEAPPFRPDSAEVAALAAGYHFVEPIAPIQSIVPLPAGTSVPDSAAPTNLTIARAVPNTLPGP